MSQTSLTSILLEARLSLTSANRKIADYILQNPIYAATMGIEELSEATGVSLATVNRFVRVIGFANYSDFKAHAVDSLQHLLAPIKNLENINFDNDAQAVIEGTLSSVVSNIHETARFVNAELLEKAAQLILSSKRMFFLGFGVSAYYANMFAYMMFPYCQNQIVLDGQGGTETVLRWMQNIGEGDLLIAISVPRYTQFSIDITERFKEAGCKVLVITDKPSSPLNAFADLTFHTLTHHPILHSSMCGIIAIFEIIISYFLSKHSDTNTETKYTQDVMQHLYNGKKTIGSGLI